MDKFLIRKDVYDELIEKGYGKRDLSKLTKKQITDKNGHKRTVYVRNGEQPAEVKQSKTQEGLSETKRAKYEEMLEKVKAGPDENALIVRGKTLNKEDAIKHLEGKLGKKEPVEKKAENEKTGYEKLSIFELQDKFNSNDGKALSGAMKEEHEKVKKELEKRTSENKPTSKGYKKGDTVFDRYGETSEVIATSDNYVYVKDSRGRKEWKSENSFEGKKNTD